MKKMFAILGVGVFVVLAIPRHSLQAQAPTVVVRAGVLIDGTGAEPLRNAMIVIEDGRIVDVGSDLRVPRGATQVDLSDYTVLPGFIDAHTHLVGRVLGEPGWANAYVRDTPADRALRGVEHARQTVEAGFTTVRNVGAVGFADVSLRDAIEAGRFLGPRMITAAHSLGITGGHCDTNGYVPNLFGRETDIQDGVANGHDDIVRAIRYQVKYGADVIKFCATGGVLSEGDSVGVQQYTFEEMRAIVETSHMLERRVAAHAHGTEGIKVALRAGVNSIEHGSILDDEAIELFLETGAYLVPTLMAAEAVTAMVESGNLTGERAEKALYISPLMFDSFRRAARAGVNVALGTDAGVMPHGNNGHEFTLMVRYGMEPMQAIVAGTSNAADLLGLGNTVGSLTEGFVADLVAVRGNPLENIEVLETVSTVMLAGRVVVDNRE